MLQEVRCAFRIDSVVVARAVSAATSLCAGVALRFELQVKFLLLLILESAGLCCRG